MTSQLLAFAARLAKDERGQDLVEYALLGMFVAIATILGLRAIEQTVGTNYINWDTNEQNLWRPLDPGP